MKRKKFIQLSSALINTPLLSAFTRWDQEQKLTNWAGNVEYSTSKVYYPKGSEELSRLVSQLPRLRALGTRHCFNRIADSKDALISTSGLNQVVSLDADKRLVTVEGGIKYGELCPYLDAKGFALHNLASLPHISVAGSISTATHGSGIGNGNLATAVRALDIVRADGELIHLSQEKDGEHFLGTVVAFGALGIVYQVSLDIQPSYQMKQYVFENLPMAQLGHHFDQIIGAAYSVSLFTDWRGDSINEVWIKNRTDSPTDYTGVSDFYGGKAATQNMHPIASLSAVNCTEQLGVAGPWYERLPHFKMGFTPSSGKELQSEYFVPHQQAMEAILAIQRLGKQISPHLLISEIRSIASDTLWMSPCRNQSSVTIHFTWKPEWEAVRQLLPLIERELAPYKARPHWGKLFTLAPDLLDQRYEKLGDFRKLVASFDPKGKFRNDFVDKYLFTA
jgi:xylitol oxidase